jgi:hypothetical protein
VSEGSALGGVVVQLTGRPPQVRDLIRVGRRFAGLNGDDRLHDRVERQLRSDDHSCHAAAPVLNDGPLGQPSLVEQIWLLGGDLVPEGTEAQPPRVM